RLPGAVRPDQADDLACADVERHAVERDDAAEALADAIDLEQGHGRGYLKAVLHPTASKVQARLRARGLDVEVRELAEPTRTASLRRFDTVWCAAGTPHAVFAVRTEDLIDAIPDPDVRPVS